MIVKMNVYIYIHSFIQKFVKRPFKKSALQRRPQPSHAIQISLKQLVEHTFIILRQEANFQRESIPGRGTNNAECSALPDCISSTRHQELATKRNEGLVGR